MQNTGQIFSLDLIMGFLLLVLAIGLSVNYFETQALNAKENQNRQELWGSAKTATDIITNSTIYMCDLNSVAAGQGHIDFLPNCIRRTIDINKNALALPPQTNCLIEEITTPPAITFIISSNPCNTAVPAMERNVASIERRVVVLTTDANRVEKKQLTNCQNLVAGCVLKEAKIRLRVWRQ